MITTNTATAMIGRRSGGVLVVIHYGQTFDVPQIGFPVLIDFPNRQSQLCVHNPLYKDRLFLLFRGRHRGAVGRTVTASSVIRIWSSLVYISVGSCSRW